MLASECRPARESVQCARGFARERLRDAYRDGTRAGESVFEYPAKAGCAICVSIHRLIPRRVFGAETWDFQRQPVQSIETEFRHFDNTYPSARLWRS